MKSLDPKNLMHLAKDGDNDAFGKLYEIYYVPVFRYIHFRINKKDETQDLVQTVFLKIFKSIEKYEEKGKDPLSFFFTVARNTVLDYLRKKKELSLNENIEVEGEENVEDFAERNEIINSVNKAIRILNEDQKEVILLKFMAELSNAEISKQLGKSQDAIRQTQHRALKILKEKLKNV